MGSNHEAMTWTEVEEIGGLLHDLSPDEWNAASLCDGWRVRDVIGHMLVGHTTPMPRIGVELLRYKFDLTKGSFEMSKSYGSEHAPAQILENWDTEMIGKHSRKGIARTIKYQEAFLDHLIHHQDIRRPLDRPREIPEERLVAAMDLLPTIKTPLFATKMVAEGLALRATDIDHAVGDGPAVEGSAEALVMAVAGRAIALDELTGEGVATLTQRLES